MANLTGVNRCLPPFYEESLFGTTEGYVEGRLCQKISDTMRCCLPCPMADWVYPDSFKTMAVATNWIAAISVVCCFFLLISWASLPVEKTNRHYLSICFTFGVLLMNLGFVVPLAAQPNQCHDTITPNDMQTSTVCGASGTLLILGGWCGVMWAFLRSLSLHLQICWQVLVGRNFMIFAQLAGWGVPIIGIVLALVFSGVSFRFGPTCHINHKNSLADLWIPLLVFAGVTVITTFATFGYCVKVYLASLSDTSASTDGSSLPTYSNSVISPRQAYRRVRRVIALQWRGIAIVLIIVADVIFFSIVFVFQDTIVESVTENPTIAHDWIECLMEMKGDKNKCLNEARSLVVNQATVSAVLILLTLNGVWLLFLLGRWTMVTGWAELISSLLGRRKAEFVSVDARYEMKKDTRSYEMLSIDSSAVVTPLTPAVKSPMSPRSPGFDGETATYNAPARSYSSPKPPQRLSWGTHQTSAPPQSYEEMNPLGMNRL